MKKNIITNARKLRKQMTEAERKLWQILRGRRLRGYRFRKQVPLEKYVVDFLCHEARIIIELDGGQHNKAKEAIYDQQRTKWLNEQGYLVQRFWNNEVLQQIETVSGVILDLCTKRTPPSFPSPTKDGGKGRSKLLLLKFRLRHVFF